MFKPIDFIKKKFGRLTVIKQAEKGKYGHILCMVEWAEEFGIKPKVLYERLQRHPIHIALTM